MPVRYKSPLEIEVMRAGGRILSDVLLYAADEISVGMSAGTLDQKIHQKIVEYGAQPSFLGYNGYRHATCISRNEEIVHGIPYEDKLFLPGDLVSVDVGVYYKGFHVDAARSFCIDTVDPEIERLKTVTERTFFECLAVLKAGCYLGDIGSTMQTYVEANGFSVIRDLCSHGVGVELHEDPMILHYGRPGQGMKLRTGMTLAIEPMVSQKSYDVITLADKWTIITADRLMAAHYENTVYIGPEGPEVLTLP
jgi:methionyl aminopeptidase